MRPRGLAAVAGALLVAACGGGDGGTTGGLGRIEEALHTLPDERDEQTVVWGDVVRAAEVAGIEAPSRTGDTEAVLTYLSTLIGQTRGALGARAVMVMTPSVAHVERATQIDEFVDDVGWSILDVDRFIERMTPPETVTVLEGDFSRASLDGALGQSQGGTWMAGDPEESPNPDDITPARPLGEAQWLALDGDLLTVTAGVDATEAVVHARSGDEPTLGDDEALAAVARALDGAGAYAVMLARPGVLAPSPDATEEQRDAVCQEALPESTAAVGTGAAAGDDAGLVLVALAHESDEAASANAAALERILAEGRNLVTLEPWHERLAVDQVDVDGSVVAATLRPVEDGRIDVWSRLILERAGFVSSC